MRNLHLILHVPKLTLMRECFTIVDTLTFGGREPVLPPATAHSSTTLEPRSSQSQLSFNRSVINHEIQLADRGLDEDLKISFP